MALSNRERYISVVVLLAGAVFTVDRLALGPYLAQRDALFEQRQVKDRALTDAQQLLRREQTLRRVLAKMGASVEAEPSAAEGRLMHLMHDWGRQAGVANASFHRVRAVEEHGFNHMTFHVSATGTMGAVAMLIYRVETAPIPLRVDDVHVTPVRDGGEELQVQLSVSTLCGRGGGRKPERGGAQDVAALATAGERR